MPSSLKNRLLGAPPCVAGGGHLMLCFRSGLVRFGDFRGAKHRAAGIADQLSPGVRPALAVASGIDSPQGRDKQGAGSMQSTRARPARATPNARTPSQYPFTTMYCLLSVPKLPADLSTRTQVLFCSPQADNSAFPARFFHSSALAVS